MAKGTGHPVTTAPQPSNELLTRGVSPQIHTWGEPAPLEAVKHPRGAAGC